MGNHIKEKSPRRMSRRKFLMTAAAGASIGVLGFPHINQIRAAAPVKLKIQTVWEGGTLGYVKFQDFCNVLILHSLWNQHLSRNGR